MTMNGPFRIPGSSGGGPPRDRRAPQATNEVTLQQVDAQARVARRVGLLKSELPGLAVANESLLVDLASGADDDADMMQAAIDAMSINDKQLMLDELKAMPKEQQQGYYKVMNPIKRKALEDMGWKPPRDRGGFGGFLDDNFGDMSLKDAFMGGFRPLGQAGKMLPDGAKPATWAAWGMAKATAMPGVKQVLGGFDYVAEEASRTQRILPQMQSGQRVLDETGLTADQLYEQTGIRTTGAAGKPLVEGTTGAMMSVLGAGNQNPLEWLKHPSDIWRAAQTWNAIGHEGSDDFLPEVQMQVFRQLEDEGGDNDPKDMLRWAKGIAAGHTVAELAEMDGLEGDQAAYFKAQVSVIAASPQFKKAVAQLTSGQMSAGRTMARQVWNDPVKDTSKGAARYVSGGTDAVWNLVADPTLVAGKVTKSIKAAKWAIKAGDAADDLNRFQEMVKAVRLADEGAEGVDLAADLARIGEKYGTKTRTSKLAQQLDRWSPVTAEAQARAVYEPAKAISEAVKTGDYGKLVRQHPVMERHIADIKRYDAALKTAQREAGEAVTGLTRPEDVFEFYKHAATNRSILNTVDDTARIKFKSQRMFGRDGGGHLVVPHMTNPQRKLMEAREGFRNWRYNLEEGTATLPVGRKPAAAPTEAAAPTPSFGLDLYRGNTLATRPAYDAEEAFGDVLATMGGVSRRFDANLGSWDSIVRRLRDLDTGMFEGATVDDLRKWSSGVDLDALSAQVRSQFDNAEGGSLGNVIDLQRQADGSFRRSADHARLDAMEEFGVEISVEGGTYQLDGDLGLFLLYYDQLDGATKAALEQALDDAGVKVGRTAREASPPPGAVTPDPFLERKAALEDMKASADEAHQSLVDEGLAEPFDPDDWIVDSDTFTYQRKPPQGIKKVINQLIDIASTPTTKRGYVPVTDDVATSAEEFRAFNETMGLLAGDNVLTRRERFNRFVNGTIQDRHALLNQMMTDMADLAGITATEEGQQWIKRFVDHNNQIYGQLDAIAVANGESLSSKIVKQGIFESQIAEALTVPSAKDMLVASRNANMLRWITGSTRKSVLEAGMTRVWKPAQLMRLGFPLRAGADEALQFIGRVSLMDYVDKAVLQKWAGIKDEAGKLIRDPVTGHVVMEAQGAIKPIRSFTRSWATMFGVTDESLDNAARELAARNPEWIRGNSIERGQLLAKHRAEVAGNLSPLPKAVRHIDQLAHDTALKSAEWFHKTAVSKYVSRQEFAEQVLKAKGKYAQRIEANRLMHLHPIAQHGAMETTGNTFIGLRPGSDDPLQGVGMLAFDKDSPTRFKYVPVTKNSKEWEWVGHDDLSSFYLNMDHWMRSANQNSPAFRALSDELLHHVPQSVVDEFARYGEDGMGVLADMRAAVADADPELSNILMMSVDNDASAETIRKVLEERGLETDNAIEEIIANWDEMSPKAKWIVTDQKLSTAKLTPDFATVQDRAANAAHNAMRRLDQASNQRSLVRGQMVDGVPVAKPLREGHTRVYGVMVDRRNAEDLIRLFNDESMMQTFAERVSEHLGSANLKRHMKTAWEAGLPTSEGYDFATWMAGMKANIIQGSGSYVPAMMTGTSNPAIASAIRDAIADVMPEQVLRPTIGFLDHPDDLFTKSFGMEKLDDSVVWMSPNQASTMEFIDPDNQVKMVHVQTADGEKIWLGENEVEGYAGKKARIDRTEVEQVFRSRGMVAWDNRAGKVKFNSKLIDQDYRDGMKFLRGEGGEMSTRGAVWGWDEPDAAEAAEQLIDVLDAHGFTATTGLDLDQLIGLYRTKGFRTGPIPFEDVMRDNELWDDFTNLANGAKKKGQRDIETWFDQRTADESKIVKAGLDRLGINVDDLNLTKKQYQSLLIYREQAHAGLRPKGYRGVRSASAESIEREADALAIAFQKAGIDVGDDVAERVLLATGTETADYSILGEIWGNGVTEDVAMRRTAQDQLNEALGWVVGRQSGEVLHEILAPLRRGSHTQQNLWTRVALDELPTKSFGPMRVATGETRWDKVVRRTFDGAWDPTISAISRSPMYADAFHKSLEQYRVVHENTVIKSLDTKARSLLTEHGFDPEDLRDVNRIVGSQLKANPQLGADLDDPFVEYLKAVNNLDADEAAKNLARIKLRDKLPEDPVERKALLDKEAYHLHMDEDSLKVLRNWHTNQTHAVDEWVHRSTQHALEMVTPFIDDHRIRSAMQEYLGPVVVPYLYAEEQFLRRVARGLYETPHMLRKGQLTMNGMRNIGMIREDAYGNEVFVIPGSELLMGRVADVAEMITGNPAMQVLDQPLTMRTDFVLPGWNTQQSRWGWGPIIGMSVDQMTQRYPEYEFRKDDPNRPWWSYVVPGPVSGAYKAWVEQSDPTQLASAQIAAISYLEANGHGLPDNATASQKEDYLENVRQVSRTIGILRYASGQMSFTTASPFDAEAMMRKEFTDLLSTGLDYDQAINRFIEEHGPEALVYTVFGTTNETGAPLFNTTTEEALNWMLTNDKLVQDNPSAMAWLLPQGDEKSPFDRRAYNEQLSLGLRTRKSPQEMVDAVRVKQAAEDYWTANENYNRERTVLKDRRDAALGDAKRILQDQLNKHDEQWRTWKDGYLAKHPTFAESLTQDASDRRKKTLDDLRWLLESGVGGEQAEEIKPMVEAYHAFTSQYSAYASQNSKAAQLIKEDILKDYFDEQWLYVQEHPKAAPFWNSVIRPELPDAADPLVRDSEALGGA